jgi:hypothetical protein
MVIYYYCELLGFYSEEYGGCRQAIRYRKPCCSTTRVERSARALGRERASNVLGVHPALMRSSGTADGCGCFSRLNVMAAIMTSRVMSAGWFQNRSNLGPHAPAGRHRTFAGGRLGHMPVLRICSPASLSFGLTPAEIALKASGSTGKRIYHFWPFDGRVAAQAGTLMLREHLGKCLAGALSRGVSRALRPQ